MRTLFFSITSTTNIFRIIRRHELALTAHDTPEDVVRRMRYLRPAHEFRKKFLYTNHVGLLELLESVFFSILTLFFLLKYKMYILAAHLISRYSGMSYSEFVRTRIFEPLGMDSTTFDTHSDIEKNMSQGWSDGGRRVPILLEGKAIELTAAPGGVMSSAADLVIFLFYPDFTILTVRWEGTQAKWIKMLLARGVDPTTNRTILSRAAFDVITTPLHLSTLQLRPDLGVAGYGLGWFKGMYEGRPVRSPFHLNPIHIYI